MIHSINIHKDQKYLYLESLDILDEKGIHQLYNELERFIERYELKELEEIKKQNFSSIAGMRKKEAEEKKRELNTFGFLINNL